MNQTAGDGEKGGEYDPNMLYAHMKFSELKRNMILQPYLAFKPDTQT